MKFRSLDLGEKLEIVQHMVRFAADRLDRPVFAVLAEDRRHATDLDLRVSADLPDPVIAARLEVFMSIKDMYDLMVNSAEDCPAMICNQSRFAEVFPVSGASSSLVDGRG